MLLSSSDVQSVTIKTINIAFSLTAEFRYRIDQNWRGTSRRKFGHDPTTLIFTLNKFRIGNFSSTFTKVINPIASVMFVLRQATNEDSEDWEAEMDGKSEPRVFNNESFALSSTFTKFHRLPLPLDKIFLVDNAQSLRECTRALCVVSYVLRSLRNFTRRFI